MKDLERLLEEFYADKGENVPRMSLEEAKATGLMELIYEQTNTHV